MKDLVRVACLIFSLQICLRINAQEEDQKTSYLDVRKYVQMNNAIALVPSLDSLAGRLIAKGFSLDFETFMSILDFGHFIHLKETFDEYESDEPILTNLFLIAWNGLMIFSHFKHVQDENTRYILPKIAALCNAQWITYFGTLWDSYEIHTHLTNTLYSASEVFPQNYTSGFISSIVHDTLLEDTQ